MTGLPPPAEPRRTSGALDRDERAPRRGGATADHDAAPTIAEPPTGLVRRLHFEVEHALPTAVYLNAAHELRAPLARMVEEIESLREPDHGALNPAQAEIARNLAQACRRMQRLVEECFTYGRMVSDDIPFHPQSVDLLTLFTELELAWEPAFQKKGVRLELQPELDRHGVNVLSRCDPHKLLRIVSVLFENALKFTPPGGTVSLRWLHTSGRDGDPFRRALRIEVQDTGCGIAAADQATIFQPFVRLNPTGTPLESGARRGTSKKFLRRRDDTAPGVGLGLGLAVAARLVELHGGRITVESQPGQGSTFAILLPQEEAVSVAAVE